MADFVLGDYGKMFNHMTMNEVLGNGQMGSAINGVTANFMILTEEPFWVLP